MDIYARWFSRMALIYLALGVVMGVVIGAQPEWSERLRFVHIHLNLLGFMTMMIAGVAYHVLPRFNAQPVPWPGGVKVHFILHNTGLIGMSATHLAGGLWSDGPLHAAFVLFALTIGAGLLIMVYNLLTVLFPAKESEPITRITGGMTVGEVLDRFPNTLPMFLDAGFQSLSNPVARKTFAKVVTLQKACEKHDVDIGDFLNTLNAALFDKPGGPPAAQTPPKPAAPSDGVEMRIGQPCTGEVRVGSLIKLYPEAKDVFEKHYGKECFTCPGQVYETVEQTARMHNIDPALILREINEAIGK